ncbi:DUF1992 domain-containing protein [Herbiconiux flava]|uniref:DnaJ homologue subfamily C member 28 conserved domain-containing protein n=1 Tax=Herbiconiux flava TaxID=881268 RepID=A0A852SSY5_9MICO|nr:hypothetical protein [Herbiconiux flava]
MVQDRSKRDDGRVADPRLKAARYRTGTGDTDESEADDAGRPTMEQRAQYVEIQIAQAMRRGDFDDLPGAGKPLTGLGGTYDPDWWIRQKIERERLTGLGPPALTLRTEDAELDARLDATHGEHAVRELLGDFNRRVIEARRQLQGGPPVVTATRDVDAEVAAWRERREERGRVAREAREREDAEIAALPWRERRRALRARRLRDGW